MGSEVVGIKHDEVSSWMIEHLDATAPLDFELIAGGRSNLTFQVTDAAHRRFALRRPPTSHVLPTAGTGRFLSGLRVDDFIRRTSIVAYDRASVRRAAPVVAAFASMERLPLHGRSVAIRLE